MIWSEEFEPYFSSSDSANCPILSYEIYSDISPESGNNVQSLTANTLSSQVFIQSNANSTFQIELRTSTSFNHTKFYLRSWTKNTHDTYNLNAFASFEMKMVNCTEQWIDVLDQSEPLQYLIGVNGSTPFSFGIDGKFNTSNEAFCPITQYKIVKILNSETQIEDTSALEFIQIGAS